MRIVLATGYSPHLVANVKKEWLVNMGKAPHLHPDGTVENHDAVLPILQAAMISQGHHSYLFLK